MSDSQLNYTHLCTCTTTLHVYRLRTVGREKGDISDQIYFNILHVQHKLFGATEATSEGLKFKKIHTLRPQPHHTMSSVLCMTDSSLHKQKILYKTQMYTGHYNDVDTGTCPLNY